MWTRGKGSTGQRDRATSTRFGEESWVLILWTCSVTWGCHNLLIGDNERVSLTGGKKQEKTSKNINIIVINIHWTLLMSQALFKGFTYINSFNPHNDAQEVVTIIVPFKDEEIKAQIV